MTYLIMLCTSLIKEGGFRLCNAASGSVFLSSKREKMVIGLGDGIGAEKLLRSMGYHHRLRDIRMRLRASEAKTLPNFRLQCTTLECDNRHTFTHMGYALFALTDA